MNLESIAKHCIDDNITSDQIAYMLRMQAELERLRGIEAATTWRFDSYKNPRIGEIKGRYSALVELVMDDDDDLHQRARIELLTLWFVFGPPDESAELKRLRGIEAAVMMVYGPEPSQRQEAVNFWRDLGADEYQVLRVFMRDAIADALEAKP